jgi:hypothetical protein
MNDEDPKMDDPGGIFGSQAVASAADLLTKTTEAEAPDPAALPPASVLNGRKALRRLQSAPPTEFERVIDLLYEWKEYAPEGQATDFMRRLLGKNHNLSDANAVAAMKGFVTEARKDKINAAIFKLGLDEAERILGLKEEEK